MKIYHDNLIEYHWFKNLNKYFDNFDNENIKRNNANISIINEIVKYDRPDIILSDNKKGYLVIEKTREVPTGHNVGQRMARLIRAVELKIPTIFFCPFKARKHGKYSSICNINGRLFQAYEKIWNIHNVPIFLVNWKCDDNGELINDGTEDLEIKEIIQMLINTNFIGDEKYLNFNKQTIIENINKSNKKHSNYKNPPKSVQILNTNKFLKNFNPLIKKNYKEKLNKHKQTVIYEIKMKPEKAKRQDPYTGMQFIYDYLYCRNGIRKNDKNKNLILYFPLLNKKLWETINPNDNTKNSNWYLTANGLLFKDGFISIR